MKGLSRRFRDRERQIKAPPPPRKRNSVASRVIVPHVVDLPHPGNRVSELKVAASINGIDMATGRL